LTNEQQWDPESPKRKFREKKLERANPEQEERERGSGNGQKA